MVHQLQGMIGMLAECVDHHGIFCQHPVFNSADKAGESGLYPSRFLLSPEDFGCFPAISLPAQLFRRGDPKDAVWLHLHLNVLETSRDRPISGEFPRAQAHDPGFSGVGR